MIERVRRAATSLMLSRSSVAGGMISRSFSALSQRERTPMLSSTSSSRLTSSMRATRRSVVRPRLSSDAQSSATPAFFEVFTAIEPCRRVGPTTRRWVGPCPMLTSGLSRASPIRASMSSDRFWWPRSMRLTALWLVPSTSASCCCVHPRCLRASRIRWPMRPR